MILTLYEPFRHWSETGSVYILSDPHFGDSDCRLMNPGWIEPEEQVARINALVMKNDTFVCLGDVGDPSYVKQIKARKKILLLGNHDKKKDYKAYSIQSPDARCKGKRFFCLLFRKQFPGGVSHCRQDDEDGDRPRQRMIRHKEQDHQEEQDG